MAIPAIPARRLVILLIVTAIGLMTLDAREVGPFNGVRRTMFTITQPLRSGVDLALRPVTDAWGGTVHYRAMEDENARLRERVAVLEAQIDRLPEVEAELAALRLATDITYVGDLEQVTARVVSDRNTDLERLIEIDRGGDHGLREGQPVVTGHGLIGRLLAVESTRSQVQLITDPRMNVGVINPLTRATGVATGDGIEADLVLDLVDGALARVNAGSRFETSGFERSRYPGGIPVGRLRVDGDSTYLVPVADLDKLVYVTVLLVTEVE